MSLKTMVREVKDDFEALMMCNAMEECGGQPFSVVYQGYVRDGFGEQQLWHVFGRVEEGRYGDVDNVFERLMTVPK